MTMIELPNENSAKFDLSSLDLLDLSDPFFPDDMAVEVQGEKFIVFVIDSGTCAIPSRQVAEIFQPLAITSLPNTPPWLLGITNFRSDIISVVDLQKLWNNDALLVSPKAKLVVVRSETDSSLIAVIIDKFSEIVTIADDKIERFSDHALPGVYAKATHKSSEIHLIDAQKLFALDF
ncbi:MAG: chemotaxis protein CheW [Pyrinomonadaceae bacterium]|nr:chemotaxis protein CheW [Pyrinomonadaceae bacterium]